MKKLLSAILSAVMALSISTAVFAQDIETKLDYNLLVNGQSIKVESTDAVSVDGKVYVSKDLLLKSLSSYGLTELALANSSDPFNFNTKDFYTVEAASKAAGLTYFNDEATNTDMVANTASFDAIKALMEKSNNLAMKTCQMEVIANVLTTTKIGDSEALGLDMAMDANINFDLDAPFMSMDANMGLMGEKISIKLYDDGKYSYVGNATDGWIKTVSAIGQAKEYVDMFSKMVPTSSVDYSKSYAGLSMTQKDGDTIISGNMFAGDIYKSLDFDGLMKQMTGGGLVEGVSFKYNMPNTMYVSYVFDKNGNVKSMAMKFSYSMEMTMDGETTHMDFDMDLQVPKYIINGAIDKTIPQDVIDSATDMSELLTSADETLEAQPTAPAVEKDPNMPNPPPIVPVD